MVLVTNGITALLSPPRGIPPLRRQQARPVVNRVGSAHIGGHPQLRQRLVTRVASAPPVMQLTPAYQAATTHQLQPVDPAPPVLELQPADQARRSVDQTDGNRSPEQRGGQETRTILGISNTGPDAPSSLTSGISSLTLFKVLAGVVYAATAGLTLYDLQKQGSSVPASSKKALTTVYVTFLFGFAFIAAGACAYKRFPDPGYVIGNAGFLCFTVSFFAMMQICAPKLAGLVWTVCGILLVVFAYFFFTDLKDRRKIEADRRRRITAV